MIKDRFTHAQFLRAQFQEQTPFPKLCGACYFLEDWDEKAPGSQPRLCIDCTGERAHWWKKLDAYIEEHTKKSNK